MPSADGRHGDLYVFKTPHHPDFRLDGHELMTKIGAATSAAPTYYRPLEDGGYTFVDGGLWANNPIMVGLVDALSCFTVPSKSHSHSEHWLRCRALHDWEMAKKARRPVALAKGH